MPQRKGLMLPDKPLLPPADAARRFDQRRCSSAAVLAGLAVVLLASVASSACKPDRLPGESPVLSSEERFAAAESALMERRPIAWIDGDPILIDDVDRWIAHGSLLTRTWFHEHAVRQEALGMLVDTLLMAREGQRLTEDDDLEILIHQAITVARAWIRPNLVGDPPSEDEIIAFIQEDPARWRVPPHREVTAFTFHEEDEAHAFHELLVEQIEQSLGQWIHAHERLLGEWSDTNHEAPGVHGHLGRVSPIRMDIPEAIRRAAFEGNEVSSRAPFPVDDHWVVLWVGIDTPAVDPPDAVVIQRASNRLAADRQADLVRDRIDRMRDEANVEINHELLARVSAARQRLLADEDRPTLPRLLSAERIADHPSAALGLEQYQAIEDERRRLGRLAPALEALDRWEAQRSTDSPETSAAHAVEEHSSDAAPSP